MDSRIPIVTNSEGESWAFGRRFANLAAAERYVTDVINRRETIAGRKLSAHELQHGVAHKNDMDERAKIDAANWRPVPRPNTAERPHPFDQDTGSKKETRKQLFARMRDQYDARIEREGAEEEDDKPRRAKAKAMADELWEQVAFDSSATTSQLTAVEQLRRQADGDLATYKTMNEEVTASRQTEHDKQVAVARAEAEQALARLNALRPAPSFDGAPGVGPSDTVTRWRGGKDGEEVVVLSGNIIKHKWPAAEAPAEIAALAPEFPN